MNKSFKTIFIAKETDMVSLYVNNVGFQKCEPGHTWGCGVRDHFLIHHIVKGVGYYETNGNVYTLKAGDSFLVYPYVEIKYYADMNDPWEYYWVGFSGADAANLMLSTDFSRELPLIHHPSDESSKVKRRILDIYEIRGNSLAAQTEMTGKLYTALAFFIKISGHKEKCENSYQSYVKAARNYIATNYSYGISVDEIADYVGISRSHLFRAFKTYTGESPKEYLSNYRINTACTLLRETNLSITAISKSVGFENNLYFSKAFRKIKGMSPSQYAKEHR